MDPIAALAARWREDAERFRSYGDERGARTCELHVGELEGALRAARVEAVTLEEAAELGGYSYSHLQALVAEGKIANVGSKGAPRIRRCDVPVKPGRGRPGPGSAGGTMKARLLDRSVRLVREETEA